MTHHIGGETVHFRFIWHSVVFMNMSTLTADRAKAIKTQAVVNESPTEKLIRELREENARLMEQLKSGGVMPSGPASGGGDGGAGGCHIVTAM